MNRDELLHKLGNNHNALASEIKKGVIQASIPVLQKLCELPNSDLEQVYLAAAGCGEYCRIYCSNNVNGVPGEEIMIKAGGRRSTKKIYPLMPIKQMPAYDPDADIISLTLTIPSWIESIKRKCSTASLENNSSHAINRLTSALTKLCEECSSTIDRVARLEDRHE